MHQISLLGGLGNGQHSDAAHYIRPDRVYQTGVLAPMTGFRPGQAVMATANAFTSGPYTGMQLSGLRGVGARLSAWWQNVKARAQAGRAAYAMPALPAPTAAQPAITNANGRPFISQHNVAPMAAYGETMGPAAGLPHALTSRAYGQSSSLPSYAADAAAKTTMMRWRGVRWPWG